MSSVLEDARERANRARANLARAERDVEEIRKLLLEQTGLDSSNNSDTMRLRFAQAFASMACEASTAASDAASMALSLLESTGEMVGLHQIVRSAEAAAISAAGVARLVRGSLRARQIAWRPTEERLLIAPDDKFQSCTFCGVRGRLVAGPSVFICSRCISECENDVAQVSLTRTSELKQCCSFCGRGQSVVEALFVSIARSANSAICSDCARLAGVLIRAVDEP